MRQNIAVVGSGISGLTAAYVLSQAHDVTVFESADNIGGHTATKFIGTDSGRYAIDTGFIVYNDRTYPNFIRLLNKLGVAGQKTTMGFGVCAEADGLEYSGTSFNGLFAQRKNLFSLSHLGMLLDIVRFNRQCTNIARQENETSDITLGEFTKAEGYGAAFLNFYLFPMVAAIWSSDCVQAADMPLRFFINFFHNHGLFTVFNQPQWYTVQGGSQAYLEPLTTPFITKIKTATPVTSIRRQGDSVEVAAKGEVHSFDHLILACHSDQALALLADPGTAEREILGNINYQANDVVLHTDERILPQSKRAWASWNYRLGCESPAQAVLTYNMNILQSIKAPETFCVSVNPGEQLDQRQVLGRYQYHHPVFTRASTAAQRRWHEISGVGRTHYCGAYWRNGFHEDGVVSALKVAEFFGLTL